jgi:microcystin-dependent protein
MKSKLLLLSFLMLLAVATTFAQTSASASGIAIQGIARDIDNTAITSKPVTLKFTIYYGADTVIYNVSKALVTDAFGVFSTVINPGVANNSLIANNQAFLKIEEGGTTIISDEPLNHVPYAIAANNGVPTGSIMPYVGTTAPEGWALCNGQSLTGIRGAASLISLIGNNAPKLGGMFLRGAGTNTNTDFQGNDGPLLKETQKDDFKQHSHGPGTLSTDVEQEHSHTTLVPNKADGVAFPYSGAEEFYTWNNTGSTRSTADGRHEHKVTGGATAPTGNITETRPVSYGVNYIIKL